MLLSYYLKRTGFCLMIVIPAIAFLLVFSAREKTCEQETEVGSAMRSTATSTSIAPKLTAVGKGGEGSTVDDRTTVSSYEVRLVAYTDLAPPQKLAVADQQAVYPTTGAGNPFSSNTAEELPPADEMTTSELPSTIHSNAFVIDPANVPVPDFDPNEGDRKRANPLRTIHNAVEPSERKRSNFEFVAPVTPEVSSTFRIDESRSPATKMPVANEMVDESRAEIERQIAGGKPRTAVSRNSETQAGSPFTSPKIALEYPPQDVIRVAQVPYENNSIRKAVSPEQYFYSEQKSDPTTIENAWNNHKSPEKITSQLWWTERARQPLREQTTAFPIDLDSLLIRALEHSAQIRVFSELPLIRDTAITEACATFDWSAFMETMWNDTSDPVGSTLTTNASRFNDHHATASAGLRKRNQYGGQVEVAQEFGHQNNNSNFFIPNDQGTARLRMSYSHPLLRGGGKYYNQSLIVLARVDSKVARDELERQVEGHLLEVTRAYWGLALERAAYLQRVRLFERSSEIRDNLVGRQGLDTYRSQIVRADSAVSAREAALIRAEVAVRNAEARVRALVNDPAFGDEQAIEIIPTDSPIDFEVNSDLEEVLLVAMQNRSEVLQAFKQIKAAGVRKEMTKNELLPTLNMVMNSYLSGLRGNSDIPQAWEDQFTRGAPSYGVGFQYDMPVRNKAAKARHQRRRLELRQFESQLRLTMETVKLEVGVAVRESDASFREMQAKFRAMTAASEDAQFVKQRWELLPGDHQNASLVFDDLLRTQQRLTDAENEFAKAQITYNLSLTNIKKAAGILLETERITTSEIQDTYAPQIMFDKEDAASHENVPPNHKMPAAPAVEQDRQASLGSMDNRYRNTAPVVTSVEERSFNQ